MIRNCFSAQFDELENVYKITQETLEQKFIFDWNDASVIIIDFYTPIYILILVVNN